MAGAGDAKGLCLASSFGTAAQNRLRGRVPGAIAGAMAVTEIISLFASTLAAAALQGGGGASAQLGVTATVVRPPEIVTVSAEDGESAAIVRNSESVEVLASGGTIVRKGMDTAAVSNGGAETLVLTIVY